LGLGRTAAEAALRVHISLNTDVDAALDEYVAGWRAWQGTLVPLDPSGQSEGHNTYRVSTAVLRTHEARSFAGYIASLSVPWGFAKSDHDLGGYLSPGRAISSRPLRGSWPPERRRKRDRSSITSRAFKKRMATGTELLARRNALLERRAA
jgi:hypothetical protein